jgi:Flp pilus assembly protein TadB
MQNMPNFVVGAAVVAALVIAIVLGSYGWIAFGVALAVAIAFFFFDRRQRAREGSGERLAAEANPDS